MSEPNEIILSIQFDDDAPTECGLMEFLAQNFESLSEVEQSELADLGIGGVMTFGGGASPVVTVERVK